MTKLTDRLKEQSAATGITQAEIARALEITQQAVNNLFNGRAASSSYWREIAQLLQIPEDEMRTLMIDAGRDPEKNKSSGNLTFLQRLATGTPYPPSNGTSQGGSEIVQPADQPQPNAKGLESLPMQKPGKMIPVLGEVVGGDEGEYIFNGQVQDWVACPPSLVNVPNAYSVWVDGESMSPRYRPGETVFVHPGRPARRGDDVVVQVKPKEEDQPPHGYIKEFVGWTASKLILRQYNPEKPLEFDKDDVVSVHPIVLSGKYA